jgi:hypothetical protein
MRLTLNVLGCLCLLLCLGRGSDAKDWRGIVPLQSTRADVEKLLGPPPPPPSDGTQIYSLNAGRSIYRLDEAEVYIVYASENTEGWNDCAGKVPEGTVLSIDVTPKDQMTLADLKLDVQRLIRFEGLKPNDADYKGYLDEEAGIGIRTFRGKVEEITYLPNKEDRHLCPSYFKNLKDFVRIQRAY